MFIRSPTATNDCLIALDQIQSIRISGYYFAPRMESGVVNAIPRNAIAITMKDGSDAVWDYESPELRNKAYEELCSFLTTNYKLRDFT